MKERLVDADISLVPYYPNPAVTLPWYQDADVCKQVNNIDHVYSPERLEAMYTFLSTHGDCFYIIYRGKPVGDVTLRDNGELAIVVSKAWQNRGIGRRCIREMLRLAKEKGGSQVTANVYAFNAQSRKMFQSCGFRQTEAEWLVRDL